MTGRVSFNESISPEPDQRHRGSTVMSASGSDSGLEVWIKIAYWNVLHLQGFESGLCQLSVSFW